MLVVLLFRIGCIWARCTMPPSLHSQARQQLNPLHENQSQPVLTSLQAAGLCSGHAGPARRLSCDGLELPFVEGAAAPRPARRLNRRSGHRRTAAAAPDAARWAAGNLRVSLSCQVAVNGCYVWRRSLLEPGSCSCQNVMDAGVDAAQHADAPCQDSGGPVKTQLMLTFFTGEDIGTW